MTNGPGTAAGGDAAPGRVPGLDLLRASAALAVIVGHFLVLYGLLRGFEVPEYLHGLGFYGVELFFVLSGFLIGGLLLDILDRGPSAWMWRRFLVRRWMRTVPLYAFWVLVLLVLAPPAGRVAEHAIEYLTFTQNLAWPMPRGNWFGVSWTLAVEEWFYLLFSALLIGLAMRGVRSTALIACTVFLALPVALRLGIGMQGEDWDRGLRKIVVYRLDAIAYGVALVCLWRSRREMLVRLRWALFAGGCLCIALSRYVLDHPVFGEVSHSVTLSLTLAGFALAFPLTITVRRLPLAGVIRWLSVRSYALYIVHLDIGLMLLRGKGLWQAVPTALYLPLTTLITLVVADLCYRWIESPFMRRRPPQFPPEPAPAAGRGGEEPAPVPMTPAS